MVLTPPILIFMRPQGHWTRRGCNATKELHLALIKILFLHAVNTIKYIMLSLEYMLKRVLRRVRLVTVFFLKYVCIL